MSSKKEKLLQKYLNKKKKQKKRDEIFKQLQEIDQSKKLTIETSGLNKETSNLVHKNSPLNESINEIIDARTVEEIDQDSSVDDGSSNAEVDCSYKINDNFTMSKNEENKFWKSEIEDIGDFDSSEQTVCESIDVSLNEVHENVSGNLMDESSGSEEISESSENDYRAKRQNTNEITPSITLDNFLGEEKFKNRVTVNRVEEIENQRKKLPIYYEQSEIMDKIMKHDVVFIKGETGSGKTTQIPQFLYESGLYCDRMIGVTQPRRISAISISKRINQELNDRVCGYKIRYENKTNESTKIKIMTDGVLLKEVCDDFILSKYSVIILDEIHEQSTNIDILISLLSRIVKLRKKKGNILKLIFMSATPNIDNLGRFFEEICLINIDSTNHHVNVFYESSPLVDYVEGALTKIKKILKTEYNGRKGSDKIFSYHKKSVVNNKHASILVFLPTKQDIYRLLYLLNSAELDIVALPLHSGLAKDEQSKIYMKYEKRKVIVATNIAETSITISDLVYVIDSGRVKNKFVDINGVIHYSIDFISKSSALQRSGRAGRVGPGICYRLYTGEQYETFEEHSIPQIHKETLSDVILGLKVLGIKNIYTFPFINKPSNDAIKFSLRELQGFSYLNETEDVTDIGRIASKLPLSARHSKLLFNKNTNDVFCFLVVIACCLSLDLEVRKNEFTKKYFLTERSDLVVMLKIFIDFKRAENRREFCCNARISLNSLIEVEKLYKMILKRLKIADTSNELNGLEIDKIRKVIYVTYYSQLCSPIADLHLYKTQYLYRGDHCVDCENEYVVFEHLESGKRKNFMRNITVVDKDWF